MSVVADSGTRVAVRQSELAVQSVAGGLWWWYPTSLDSCEEEEEQEKVYLIWVRKV